MPVFAPKRLFCTVMCVIGPKSPNRLMSPEQPPSTLLGAGLHTMVLWSTTAFVVPPGVAHRAGGEAVDGGRAAVDVGAQDGHVRAADRRPGPHAGVDLGVL